MRIFFALLIIFNLILFLPIILKCKINYNFNENRGYISLFFFSFNISLQKFILMLNKIYVKDKRNHITFVYYNDLTSQDKVREIFFVKIIKNVEIRNFRVISRIGVSKNAFMSCMLCGGINVVASIVGSYFCSQTLVEKFSHYSFPNYYKTEFILCFSSTISISLFMIFYCLISAITTKLRKGKTANGYK